MSPFVFRVIGKKEKKEKKSLLLLCMCVRASVRACVRACVPIELDINFVTFTALVLKCPSLLHCKKKKKILEEDSQ